MRKFEASAGLVDADEEDAGSGAGDDALLGKGERRAGGIPSLARLRAALTAGDWLRVTSIVLVGLFFLTVQFVPGLS